MSNFRVPLNTFYEHDTRYMGNGVMKFCVKCKAHRPYLAGGSFVGPPSLHNWACKLHKKPAT
jgi:hypothetical protein